MEHKSTTSVDENSTDTKQTRSQHANLQVTASRSSKCCSRKSRASLPGTWPAHGAQNGSQITTAKQKDDDHNNDDDHQRSDNNDHQVRDHQSNSLCGQGAKLTGRHSGASPGLLSGADHKRACKAPLCVPAEAPMLGRKSKATSMAQRVAAWSRDDSLGTKE